MDGLCLIENQRLFFNCFTNIAYGCWDAHDASMHALARQTSRGCLEVRVRTEFKETTKGGLFTSTAETYYIPSVIPFSRRAYAYPH